MEILGKMLARMRLITCIACKDVPPSSTNTLSIVISDRGMVSTWLQIFSSFCSSPLGEFGPAAAEVLLLASAGVGTETAAEGAAAGVLSAAASCAGGAC